MWENSTKIPSTRATVSRDLFNTLSCVWYTRNQTLNSIKSSAPVHKHWCLAHESPMLVCNDDSFANICPQIQYSNTGNKTRSTYPKALLRWPIRMIVQFAARTKAGSTTQHQSTNTGASAQSATEHARKFQLPQWLFLADDSTTQNIPAEHQ